MTDKSLDSHVQIREDIYQELRAWRSHFDIYVNDGQLLQLSQDIFLELEDGGVFDPLIPPSLDYEDETYND